MQNDISTYHTGVRKIYRNLSVMVSLGLSSLATICATFLISYLGPCLHSPVHGFGGSISASGHSDYGFQFPHYTRRRSSKCPELKRTISRTFYKYCSD